MNRRLIKSMLTAACAFAPLAIVPATAVQAQSVQRPANDVVLSIGQGQLITVGGTMTDIFVANDSVADVEIKSGRQLYLFGKGGGETTVYASNSAGQVIWSANVRVGSNIGSVDQMLRVAMPEAKISVSTMGTNTFLLTGLVAAPEDAAEAERLVKAFTGDSSNIVSRLKMATPLQVNLQVRIAEVSRSLLRNFSMNMRTIDGTSGFKFGLGQGRAPSDAVNLGPLAPFGIGNTVQRVIRDPATGEVISTIPGTAVSSVEGQSTIAGLTRLFGVNIIGALDAGEQIGLVTTLSQPNLTALSGETADFLAGGEFPIPISQGLGATSIEYKKYGVSLAYTPTVLANGRISLRVRPEVSELSSQGSVTLGNFEIPGLSVRRAETTVELGSGQSFMIAGLLSNNSQNSLSKLPGAGDVPVLGALFRSRNYRRGETELVIVVTPYLVNPVNANDIKLPTDGFREANAIKQILGNMESDGVSGGSRPMPTKGADRTANPSVGAAASDSPDQAKADRKSRKQDRQTAETAAPGFNLK